MCPTRNKIPKRHIFVLTFSLHITFERVTDGRRVRPCPFRTGTDGLFVLSEKTVRQ